MSLLDNDQIFEAVKLNAHQIGVDVTKLTDQEFLQKYHVSKVEVTMNSKVMEALSNSGDMKALMPVYFWFETLLSTIDQ